MSEKKSSRDVLYLTQYKAVRDSEKEVLTGRGRKEWDLFPVGSVSNCVLSFCENKKAEDWTNKIEKNVWCRKF